MAEMLEGEKVGVALNLFEEANMKFCLHQLLLLAAEPDTRERCINAAKKHFSLEKGVVSYSLIYEQLEK
jgi:tRNA-binding EMAP/Myf-like protein